LFDLDIAPDEFSIEKEGAACLIDLDAWLFSCVFASSSFRKIYDTYKESPSGAARDAALLVEFEYIKQQVCKETYLNVTAKIADLISSLGAYRWTRVIPCVSVKDAKGRYHRHSIKEDYKANRSNPTALAEVTRRVVTATKLKFIKQGIQLNSKGSPVISHSGYEADDLISILAGLIDERVVILRVDKDLKTIPHTCHYGLDGGFLGETTTESAEEMIHYQMVVGDTTDNIKGLKGKGESFFFKNLKDLNVTDFKCKYVDLSSEVWYTEMRAMVEMLTVEQAKTHHPELFTRLKEVLNGKSV
jgi:5'-3' exonuclease